MPRVYFSFKDSESNFFSSSAAPRVKLIPQYTPLIYSGSIITEDPVEKDLDSNSSATFTLVPNIYSVELWTHKIETKFDLLVSSDLGSSVTASDYIINDFTGSGNYDSFRMVSAPATTSSFGKNGWVALSSSSLYVYSGTYGVDGIWARVPIALWS